ncbi:MAG: hypothetical protein Q4G30_09850 [Actinomycetaceae bacterium]|nr:hypothetical protein [Actinomycetaceae bacterium]
MVSIDYLKVFDLGFSVNQKYRRGSVLAYLFATVFLLSIAVPATTHAADVWGPVQPEPYTPPLLVTGEASPSQFGEVEIPPLLQDIVVLDGASGSSMDNTIIATAWPTATGFSSPWTPLLSLFSCFILGISAAFIFPTLQMRLPAW